MIETRRQHYLHDIVAYGDRHFDLGVGLLLMPMTVYRNVHAEHLDDTPRHPLRESLAYALALLELADRSRQGRAETIIGRALALQETADRQAKTFGLWPFFSEEPVSAWPRPDFNWADFNGMLLLLIWHRHQRRLSVALAERIRIALRHASLCIRRRDVGLDYTNIAINGTFVTLSVAEVTRDDDLLAYGLDRLERLRDTVESDEGFAEYNSPVYVAIGLAGLHAIKSYVSHPRVAGLVEPLLVRFWTGVARRFHPGLRELAGPHARVYRPTLAGSPGLLGALIEKTTRGRVGFEAGAEREPFAPLAACVMQVDAPPDVVEALAETITEPRQVVTAAKSHGNGAARVQTTWLDSGFCLGSVSFQDGWEQRNNLVAYWKSHYGGTAVLRHRYLRDDRACCSGYFTANQQEGSVAVGAFLGAFADHHISFPVEGVAASFLGAVLEADGAGEAPWITVNGEAIGPSASLALVPGDMVEVVFSRIKLSILLTHHEIAPGDAPPTVLEAQAHGFRLIMPHYQGTRRVLRWSDFTRACSGYVLRVADRGAAWTGSADLSPSFPPAVLSREETERWAQEAGMLAAPA